MSSSADSTKTTTQVTIKTVCCSVNRAIDQRYKQVKCHIKVF